MVAQFCPTIEEVIYDVSMNDRPNYVLFCILTYSFITPIMTIILVCNIKGLKRYYLQADIENQSSERHGLTKVDLEKDTSKTATNRSSNVKAAV